MIEYLEAGEDDLDFIVDFCDGGHGFLVGVSCCCLRREGWCGGGE